MPELLLVGLNLPRYFSDKMLNIIYLLKKFLEKNKGHLKEHKKFISLFIIKTFESFYIIDLTDFFDQIIYTECNEEHSTIFCFLLGVHEKIRSNLKQNSEIKNKSPYYLDVTFKKHLKIVVLLILYQNLLSMDYRNIDKNNIESHRKLVNAAIKSNTCSICLLNNAIKF